MRLRLDDCSPALKKRIEDAIRTQDNPPVPATNVEPGAVHGPLAKGKDAYFDSQVDIHFHSIRKRLVDPDGLVGKYCIDAVVRAGILKDDTSAQVRYVTFSQEKGDPEKTVIVIKEIG